MTVVCNVKNSIQMQKCHKALFNEKLLFRGFTKKIKMIEKHHYIAPPLNEFPTKGTPEK